MAKNTISIIIETENLGMASIKDLELSLNSIKNQVLKNKRIKEVLLIVGNHLDESLQKEILSNYPWVRMCIEKNGLEYAESKMYGAKHAKGEILVYADSDMKYESNWLKNIIKTIDGLKGDAKTIVSGDTRLESNSAYKISLNMMWMVQISSDKIKKAIPYRHFPLNNFAIYRKAILETPIPYHIPLYRNKIPVWQQMLENKGYKTVRAPGTRGFHAPPSKLSDWWYRMLIYGSDFVALSDFSVNSKNKMVITNNQKKRLLKFLILIPWKVQQIILNSYKLLKEDTKRIVYLPLAFALAMVNLFVVIIGGIVAVFDRKLVFNLVSKYEENNAS